MVLSQHPFPLRMLKDLLGKYGMNLFTFETHLRSQIR
jgi:hypothetical protein